MQQAVLVVFEDNGAKGSPRQEIEGVLLAAALPYSIQSVTLVDAAPIMRDEIERSKRRHGLTPEAPPEQGHIASCNTWRDGSIT